MNSIIDCQTSSMASIQFPVQSEKVIRVTYPTNERIDSRFNILGDDSVLLKYFNPHIAMITTVSPPEAIENPSICDTLAATNALHLNNNNNNNNISNDDERICQLQITVVDTVSAKVIYRLSHEHANGPVHSTIIENMLVYSYWNTKVRDRRRSRIHTVHLYI